VEFYYSDVHRFFFNRFFLGDVLFISFYLKQLENKDFFKSLVIILSWGFFIVVVDTFMGGCRNGSTHKNNSQKKDRRSSLLKS
jgi:fatty-acid desaturase